MVDKLDEAMLVACLADYCRAYAQGKPDIVFVLADNLGYGELGSYGAGILRGEPTPRILRRKPLFGARGGSHHAPVDRQLNRKPNETLTSVVGM